MNDEIIYEKFTEWLKTSWFGVPDSPYSITAIQARYTPEDAEFLTGVPFRPTSVPALAEQKQVAETELGEKMDEMARKGLVWRTESEEGISYHLNDLYFVIMRSSFWPGRTDETTVEVAKQTNKYYYSGMYTDFNKMKAGGLRTVPIRATVEDGREIKPYEDVVNLLDGFEYFTVSDCPCRQRKKLDPDYKESKKPSEVCLHFDELGHYIVESGMGREITREETEEILKKSAKAGLVHGVSNWEQQPDTI
jgi:Na+-translocating ferredoxin:NAD+ oxidoreductase subunit B